MDENKENMSSEIVSEGADIVEEAKVEAMDNMSAELEEENRKEAKEAEEKAKKATKKSKKKKKFAPKNARLFMFWMDVAAAVLLAVGLYLGIRYYLNQKFISAYESGNYETEQEESLQKLNLVEPYLPYYNLGNVAYKKGDYNKAIVNYKKALNEDPPKYKECPIRINLALAMIKKIDFQDLSTEKKLQKAIQSLRAARVVLTAHGCAGPVEDDGHSEEAEKLKKDIDDMLEKLENPENQQNQQDQQDQQDQQNQQDQQDQQQNQDDQETEEEKRLREQLEEQQKQALQERSDTQQNHDAQQDQQGSDGWSDHTGKTW